MINPERHWWLGLLLVFVSGCQLVGTNQTVYKGSIIYRHGISFGECYGYCRSELEIREDSTIFSRQGWNETNYPTESLSFSSEDGVYQRVQRLVNHDAFQRLDSVYGCPDCVDGGAEWVEIEHDAGVKRVTFEKGAGPESIQDALEVMRSRREELQ